MGGKKKIKSTNAKKVMSGQIAQNNPQRQIVKRSSWQFLADIRVGEATTDPRESFMSVGSYLVKTGLNYRIREFFDAVIDNYDCYRMDRIDVYAEILPSRNSAPVTVISSFDPDDSTTPDWRIMAVRQNSKMTTLKLNEPKKLIASFVPVPNFVNTGVAGNDSPQNVVPMNRPWLDASATNQSYNGIKVCAFCQNQDVFSILFHARGTYSFMSKI